MTPSAAKPSEGSGSRGSLTLHPALIARFRDDLAALAGPSARIGLAVSGGPDSLALLLLATACGISVEAASVDHGLRPEAAAEATLVANLCARLGVPHTILPLQAPLKGNVSAWARDARYAALEAWRVQQGLDFLATAHHADDQLETLVMRLNRGSGIKGMAGIRPRRGAIIRPLLGWRKAELLALVSDAGITAVEDPSNVDDRFDRARVRKALAAADWLDPVAAGRTAAAIASAEEALIWATTRAAETRVSRADGGPLTLDPAGLPFELLRRLVIECLRQIAPNARPRDEEIHRLISQLQQGKTATLGGVKGVSGAVWRFTPVPPPRPISIKS